MAEDTMLIWKFKCGSGEALACIYEKYKNILLKLAVSLLNETGTAEDIVHDVFVSFAQSRDKLKLRGNLRSYLATCVVNRVRNRNKAGQLRQTCDLELAESISSDLKRPEQWLIFKDGFERLNNAMATLPYEQRETIALHLQGGMKFKAIARLQDIAINTVQSRYRYGLKKLQLLLNSEVGR